MSYLKELEKFDEIIKVMSVREESLRSDSDTISYDMAAIKRSLGKAYSGKGDHQKAATCFWELSVIIDSLNIRERHYTAQEVSNVQITHQKERELHNEKHALKKRNFLLLSCGVFITLLIILLLLVIRQTRSMRRKNKSMVYTIQELLAYKELLREIRYRNQEVAHYKDAEIPRQANTNPPEQNADTEENENRLLFEELDNLVNSRKLYLDRTLTREDMMKLIGVNKNRFGQIMKIYSPAGLSGYINNLRLEYAARLLRENIEITIQMVAEQSAIPNTSTFYRLFREKFGMTPVEFRVGLHLK